MAGVRRWTEEEAIRAAADRNREAESGFGGRGRHGRLRAVADAFGRSYGAVHNRAMRIDAHSRPTGGPR